MRRWKIGPDGDINVKVSGNLAYPSFILIGGGMVVNGGPVKARQYGTFVWERRDGAWEMSIENPSTDPEHLSRTNVPTPTEHPPLTLTRRAWLGGKT